MDSSRTITRTIFSVLFLWLHAGYSADVPDFRDFPVTNIFHGKPAAPILRAQGERLFRTRIREGAKEGPNFAGRYTIATWGCGSACASLVVIDAKTGVVHKGPFGVLGHFWTGRYYGDVPGKEAPYIDYQLNSRLLIVRGCPEDEDEKCATYFYEWNGQLFKLLQTIPVNRSSN